MKSFKGYIFDLDGTIYRGPALVPGARETVAWLRERGKGVLFLSNKAIQTRRDYAEKLRRLGIPVEADDVINSSLVTASYLAERHPKARVYVVGERPLLVEMAAAGLRMAESPDETDIVLLSFDRTFHYGKLFFACRAVRKGAKIIATNSDRACPIEDGIEAPDAGAVIGAVEGATGRKPDLVLGKPSPLILEAARRRLNLEARECIMVGDRLETDMMMGRSTGMATALVLSGCATRADLERSHIAPDFVLESVADIMRSEER